MSNRSRTAPGFVGDGEGGEEAIARAVRFLSAPAVVANPNTDEKLKYLQTKGMSAEEISRAMEIVSGGTDTAEQEQMAKCAPTQLRGNDEREPEAPANTKNGTDIQEVKRGGADIVVLLGGSNQASSNGSITERSDSGEVQSVEAALITMRSSKRMDDVVKKMDAASRTSSCDASADPKRQKEEESVYDVDEDVDSLVVTAAEMAADAPPSIPQLDSRDGEDDDDDFSVYDCDEVSTQSDQNDEGDKMLGGEADNIASPSAFVEKDAKATEMDDDDEGTFASTDDSSALGIDDEESRACRNAVANEAAQGWAPLTPERSVEDDFDPVEAGRASPSSDSQTGHPPSPTPSEDSLDEISRALSEIRSDDLTTPSTISSSSWKAKKIDVASAGLPLLYLGPIDVKRPARYSSLANCVSETLRVHNNRCILESNRPKGGAVIVLFGPAPSVRDDDPSNCWFVPLSDRNREKSSSGNASVSSSQRSWAPVSVDDLSAEVSSVFDVRRAHSCVAKALQHSNYKEAVEVLTDLLQGLEAIQKRQFNDFNVDELVNATRRNLAVINLSYKQYAPVPSVLRDVLWSKPGDVSAQALLGLAQVATENLEEASTTFLEILVALEKAGNNMSSAIGDVQVAKGTILNNLACCFIKRGEFARAKTVYERALDCLLGSPDIVKSALTLSNLAKCLVQTKEYDLALETLGSSIETLQSCEKREGWGVEWHCLAGIMKARALVAASVKQYMLALDTYEEMLKQLDYKEKEQYDLILEVYGNMAQITSEIGIYTPESGATFLKMLEARREDVNRMRRDHFDSLGLEEGPSRNYICPC